MKPSRKIAIGEVFGRLTVVEPMESNGWKGRSLCRCTCGVTRPISNGGLLRGKTISCGCAQREGAAKACRKTGAHNRKYTPEDSNIRYLHNRYKSGAKRRGLYFDVDFVTFMDLTSSRCHYCKASPVSSYQHPCTTIPYFYNGLDRKDPEVGYTVANSVSCCGTCNLAKRNMTYTQFLDWIARVYGVTKDIPRV